jgi:hypothetical protein
VLLRKSPLHVLDYESLLRYATGSTLVHVRRDAPGWFASFMAMVVASRAIFSADVSPQAVAAEWLSFLPAVVARAEADLVAAGTEVVVLEIDQLGAEPVATIEPLFASLGLERPPPDAVLAMARSMKALHRHPTPDLSAFGLRAADVTRAFRDVLGGSMLRG